jgi:hypothetical protein
LQELAHLYHYYLHGEQGNRTAGGSKAVREGRLPNGEPFPDIVLQYQVGGVFWGGDCVCFGARVFVGALLVDGSWQWLRPSLLPLCQPDMLLLPPSPFLPLF